MSQTSDELYSYLFALRISLQDSYQDEIDIISELKHYLMSIKDTLLSPENQSESTPFIINQVLYGFYQYFNIDISFETIASVRIVNNHNVYNFYNNNEPNNEELNNDNNEDNNEDNDYNNEEIEDNIEENNYYMPITVSVRSYDITNNNYNNRNIEDRIVSNYIRTNYNYLSSSLPNQSNFLNSYLLSGRPNRSSPLNIINTRFPLNPLPSFSGLSLGSSSLQDASNFNTHESLLNVINTIINGNINENINNLEDVAVTVDEKELQKLDSYQLKSNLDSDCIICMDKLEKDNIVTKLECKHIFHKDCIEPYFKKYNHKCPICRAEVGKPKYNL